MKQSEFIDLLKIWIPKDDLKIFGPTKEGTGQEIRKAIKMSPNYFIDIIDCFKELDPTYVRALLNGFYDILEYPYKVD
jgi:hypothetical protein